MKFKQKLFGLLKYAGTAAACLAVIPNANAQTQLQQRVPHNTRPQQQLRQAIEEAPRLLSAAGDSIRLPHPNPSIAQRPQVSPRAQRSGFVPAHTRASSVQLANYPSRPTQVFEESIIQDGGYSTGSSCGIGGCGTPGCSSCGTGGGIVEEDYGAYDIGACGPTSTNPCGYPTYPSLISVSDMEFFGGAQAFKGSVNLGTDGSFGFNEGLNWGFPLPLFQGLGMSGQLGARFTQSNGNGNAFTPNSREQIFVTGGIFRRVDYGLQLGVMYDYLNETWYFKGTYGQIRGEISWVGSYGNTMGFRYTIETEEEPGVGSTPIPTTLAAAPLNIVDPFNTFVPYDTYRFFYEQKLAQSGGLVHAWAGLTGESQGLIGADIKVPLTERFLVHTTGTLLIDGTSPVNNVNIGNINQSWNVGVNLVFIPKGWSKWKRAYHRPMLDVADNGSFLIGRN